MRLLDRFILTDCARLGFFTTIILVGVIAFGATIKPLSQESLLTASQLVRYVSLACVPMLQFALPFAAGFAGTLSLHRMTNDNEVIAAAASGISYRRLLMPVLALGFALAILMVVLMQAVIPRFWVMLERTIASDVVLLLEAAVDRHEPFTVGDLQIWADDLVKAEDPGTADERLHLFHVAVADLDDDGRVVTDLTAEQVVLDLHRNPEATELRLRLRDAVAYRPSDRLLAWIERPQATTVRLPRVMEGSGKRMTRSQLLHLRDHPDEHSHVDRLRLRLAELLRERAARDAVDAGLRERGWVGLVGGGPEGVSYRVEADELRGARFRLDAGGPVSIVEVVEGVEQRRFVARRATFRPRERSELQSVATGLTVGAAAPESELRFDLLMTDVQWTDLRAPEEGNRLAEVALDNLAVAGSPGDELLDSLSAELLAQAETITGDSAVIDAAAYDLSERIAGLMREIRGRLLKRYAMAMTAPLLLLLGATLAMWLRHATPLVIYLWAFLPSVVDLIVISSGEHVIRDGDVLAGTAIMWSGNVFMVLLILFAYLKLSRN